MTAAAAVHMAQQLPERRSIKMWDGDVSCLQWEAADARAPAVHFAHANGFNALTYRTLLDPLAVDMRLYASDLRGHGQTTLAANPKGMHSWFIYRDDIVRTLNELDGRPKLLVGHSMGATASLMVALAKPNWVTGLVLVEPVIMPPQYIRWMRFMRAVGLAGRASPLATQARKRRGIWPSREAMFEAYRGRGAFRTWPEQVVLDYITGGTVDFVDDKQIRLACTPGWEAANYQSNAVDIWRELDALRCPLTLIVGDKRSTCPDPVIELLISRRPEIRVVKVPGASHFLPMEAPDVVRREVRLMSGIGSR